MCILHKGHKTLSEDCRMVNHSTRHEPSQGPLLKVARQKSTQKKGVPGRTFCYGLQVVSHITFEAQSQARVLCHTISPWLTGTRGRSAYSENINK